MYPRSRTAVAIAVLAALCAVAARAQPSPVAPVPAIAARAYLLVDHNSGKTLAALNENQRVDPASITKLMTAYAVFRALRDKRMKLDDPVTISERAWRQEGSRTFVDVGTQVPASILIQGMIIQSGNDATVALAEHVAGTEEAFAVLMNQYAKELGMKDTSYRNSTGLSEPQHYTTASDIARLANAIIRDFPEYYKWYSQKEMVWNDIRQTNRNGLLWRDPTVDGMKTGFTESAGYCLVTSALRDGMRLVSVVMGTESMAARERESQVLLNYGYRTFETRLVQTAGKSLRDVRVWKGNPESVGVGVRRNLWVTVPRGTSADIRQEIQLPAQVIAPVDPKVSLGRIRLTASGQPAGEAELFALQAVPSGSLWQQARDTALLWIE